MVNGNGEIVILSTIADAAQAERFAQGMIERKLAACVSCVPNALSFYHWETDGVTRDTEVVLLIKTHRDRLYDVKRYFETEHPYDLPEFLVFDIAVLSRAYRDWINTEISK